MKQIVINNIPIDFEKKRIKNMYLKVLPPDGRVTITAPVRMNEEEIKRFVLTKMEWIKLQQEKIQQRHINEELDYDSGENIYVWGKKYTLIIIEEAGRPHIELEEDKLIMSIKPGSITEKKKHIMNSWYKEELLREISLLVESWESVIGVKSNGFCIRDMKTRWGTCNIRSKNICLSLQLAKKPPRCLEYVVVHELVHLLEKSHNNIFKSYLDQFLPEWRTIKKEMNGMIES